MILRNTVLGGCVLLLTAGTVALWSAPSEEKKTMTIANLQTEVDLPGDTQIEFSAISVIGYGTDRQLVAIVHLSTEGERAVSALETRPGRFRLPEAVHPYSEVSEDYAIESPLDLKPLLSSVWSHGFITLLPDGKWLLIAETS